MKYKISKKPILAPILVVKNYTVGIWNCTFYAYDADGEPIKNKDGSVKIYEAPKKDFSHMADYVDYEDLVEIDNE